MPGSWCSSSINTIFSWATGSLRWGDRSGNILGLGTMWPIQLGAIRWGWGEKGRAALRGREKEQTKSWGLQMGGGITIARFEDVSHSDVNHFLRALHSLWHIHLHPLFSYRCPSSSVVQADLESCKLFHQVKRDLSWILPVCLQGKYKLFFLFLLWNVLSFFSCSLGSGPLGYEKEIKQQMVML